jgi:hypothetical protein
MAMQKKIGKKRERYKGEPEEQDKNIKGNQNSMIKGWDKGGYNKYDKKNGEC